MSKLNFTPVDKAFVLGSSQINDTQEEISKLTKLILESNVNTKKKSKEKDAPPEDKIIETTPEMAFTSKNPDPYYNQGNASNYMRIGYPDQQKAVFREPQEDDIDFNLLKVIGHPKFADIVKNYTLIHHPEWLYKDSVYSPVKVPPPLFSPPLFNQQRSNFGNKYQNTVCSSVKNYVIFFIISTVIFIFLTFVFK